MTFLNLLTAQSNLMVDWKFQGNEFWRFLLLLLIILLTLAVGRLIRYPISRIATRIEKNPDAALLALFIRCLSAPVSVVVFGIGLYAARFCFNFALLPDQLGFSERTYILWGRVAQAVIAISFAYLMFRLVDIIEHYLKIWTSRTATTLDDMLVPVIRKSLRIFIGVVSILFIADNILDMELGAVIAAAGVGGLAIALAAQDTIANFFGSVNIFADRPFQVNERIRVDGFDGPVESVGFRSTRIRTLDGHLVSLPNAKIANETIENISKRPFIKRIANIGVTYNTPPDKVEQAVQIIKDVLANTEEVNRDPDLPSRVYFNEFKDYYLNILVIYWVKPPDYWLFQQVSQKVNLGIMRAFENAGIEFAFPTQTLYLNKD